MTRQSARAPATTYQSRNMRAHWEKRRAAAFWARVNRTDTCWLWQGQRDVGGYGIFIVNGRKTRAHRYALQLEGRAVPLGMIVLHSCDVRHCVNPSHLTIGTPAENNLDCRAKGRARTAVGEQNPWAKLTVDQVREIRERRASTQDTLAQIGADYGIDFSTVSDIVHRKRWRHVP